MVPAKAWLLRLREKNAVLAVLCVLSVLAVLSVLPGIQKGDSPRMAHIAQDSPGAAREAPLDCNQHWISQKNLAR